MPFELNKEQRFIVDKAIEWFYNSPEQIFQYVGPPGSGKSLVLGEIIQRLGLNIETEIAPMSYIGAASLVMRRNGLLKAKTIHSWLYEYKEIPKKDKYGKYVYDDKGLIVMKKIFKARKKLDPKIKLIIIDEAYCTPRNMKSQILKFGLKVIACGDPNQLPPVGDFPAFLIDGQIYRLTQIMRQVNRTDIISIAQASMRGEDIKTGSYGNSLVIEPKDLTDDMLLWADIIICGTNDTRDYFNTKIRSLKGHIGRLPEHGEKIVCRNNNWAIEAYSDDGNSMNLVNGLIGTVANYPSINAYHPERKTFDLIFRCESAKCMFECEANYQYINSDHKTRAHMKEYNPKYTFGELFEYAYAITCHISQGSQFNKVIYIEEKMFSNNQSALNLVGCTRAVESLIYVKA